MRMLFVAVTLSVLATPILAAPRMPPPELLGLTLGMNDLDVRKRLEHIGKLADMQPEGGAGLKQIWNLQHRRYQTLNLRLNPEFKLQWCTVYAKQGRLRYADIGDTTLARKVGRFIWIWSAKASDARPAYQITARGTDPAYASSVALSTLLPSPADSAGPGAPADSIR